MVSYESTSMEDLVGYSCGVCKVLYASVCVSPGSTPRGRTHTAAGRPEVGPGSGLTIDRRVSRVPGPTFIVVPAPPR